MTTSEVRTEVVFPVRRAAEEQTAKEANDKQSGLVDALRDMEQEDKATILTLRNQEVSSKEQAGKLQDKLQACEASSKEQHAKPPPPAQPKQPAAVRRADPAAIVTERRVGGRGTPPRWRVDRPTRIGPWRAPTSTCSPRSTSAR